MNVFISSVVRGLEPFRDAVARAASVLRHEVKRSEDFGPSTDTPQQACLAGVRWADVVVLLLGARYGDRQSSGISATHEEYQEAKSRCPVLAFVQRDVEADFDYLHARYGHGEQYDFHVPDGRAQRMTPAAFGRRAEECGA